MDTNNTTEADTMDTQKTRQKTFSDLRFRRTASTDRSEKRAYMEFPSGWAVSVGTGGTYRTGRLGPYELAIIDPDGRLVHEGDSSGVYAYLPVYRVTELMRDVQSR